MGIRECDTRNSTIMSSSSSRRPHAVIVSFPAAGQINPMLHLAKLFHLHGFYITFVNTSSGSQRAESSSSCVKDSEFFRFASIPDGYNCSDPRELDNQKLRLSVQSTCPAHLEQLLEKLKSASDAPPISCVVASFLLTFVADVVEKLGIPNLVVFWTTSACSLLGSLHLPELIRRGLIPFQGQKKIDDGYLDTPVDWIVGLEGFTLRYLSSFIRTTDLDSFYLRAEMEEVSFALRATALILNTFDHLESKVVAAIRNFFPRVHTIGPLGNLLNQMEGSSPLSSMRLSLWREDYSYREWLDSQKHGSVVYVSFGSLAILTRQQMAEFAWGLAGSNQPFLWIIRSSLLDRGREALPEEFFKETQGRGFFSGWCHQSEVLSHPSVGGFLTHGGWNSILESVCSGVPMIIWPGFADQYTNCRFACRDWEIGMEVEQEVRREQVQELVKEMMEGERGRRMRNNTAKWKAMAEQATAEGGTSRANLLTLMKELSAD